MINTVFGKYDKKKSCDACQAWLSEYWDWRDKAESKHIVVGSPKIDGMPHGSRKDSDGRLIDFVDAENEWKSRDRVLEYIASKGDEHELHALILKYRFVHHHWKVPKVAMKLHLPERTCERMQQEALWEAAKASHILVPKK